METNYVLEKDKYRRRRNYFYLQYCMSEIWSFIKYYGEGCSM